LARELVILWAGRHHRSSWEELCSSYRQRIARMMPIRDVPIRARGGADDPQRRRAEGQALMGALPAPAWTVALDSSGEMPDSEQLAGHLSRLKAEWPHPIAFLLGSDLGLDPEVVGTARWVLSLGRLTLSHELARTVLYEQLFRALSIGAGMSYHREP
jgi:23S rRNA (pseudouridine1915-N3)-methyltransferase